MPPVTPRLELTATAPSTILAAWLEARDKPFLPLTDTEQAYPMPDAYHAQRESAGGGGIPQGLSYHGRTAADRRPGGRHPSPELMDWRRPRLFDEPPPGFALQLPHRRVT